MARWGIWARGVVAGSSCGMITALVGCSAATAAAPASAQTRPPSATAAPGSATGAAATAAGATGSAVGSGSVAPLTGLSVTAAIAQRPAVAVVVAGSDPVGLGSADLVLAEMAGPVRYLAVFQSAEASTVGPVTSTRPTDGQALSVLHPLTGYDGGTTSFVSVLDASKIIDEGYAGHASLYSGGSGGSGGPTVSTAALAAAGRSDGPPPELFGYRQPGDSLASADETHPTSVRVEAPGEPAEQWNFDAGTDRWVQTAGGPRVSVANLVVQIVSFKTVYLSRKYGQTVPSALFTGKGAVTVFSGTVPGESGGTSAAGSWAKPGITTVTNYFDTAGQPMSFEPGPTWVVLAPAGTRTSPAGR
jgi:hypothetical protein